MMIGVVSACSVIGQTTILDHANFPATFMFYGNSTFPCISFSEVVGYRNHILLFKGQGGKLTPKTITYGLSRERDDTQGQGYPGFADNQVFICPEDDGHSEEPTEERATSPVQSSDDFETASELEKQEHLLGKLKALHFHVLAMEQWNSSRLKICHRNYYGSVTNLLHYLALKSLDIEQIKGELSSAGLLSLEALNPHVLSSLSACIPMLTGLRSGNLGATATGEGLPVIHKGNQNVDIGMARMLKRLSSNRDRLLGALQVLKSTHVMVTVGQEAKENDTLISDLVSSGATIFRINCAHGNPELWSSVIGTIKRCSQLLEKPCRILMDLAGPKLRTGKLIDGPCVVKISPKRNAFGRVIHSAHVWLSPVGAGSPPPHISFDVILHVNGQEFLNKLEVDDTVRFHDARGKRRTFRILSKYPIFSGVGFLAECSKPAYVASGTTLYIKDKRQKSAVGFVVDVPPAEHYVRVRIGDLLTITRDCWEEADTSVGAHKITCSSGYLFDSVKPGEPIAFDDGKIWGTVKGTSNSEVVVKITHASPKGTKLGSEKSINIPESDIRYEGLTSKDLMDLDFVAAHADMVGISFIRDIHDIAVLYQEIGKRKLSKLGIVLKIETTGGYEKLPHLLIEAMKYPNPLGVMIARGDLAVECGWENLADIQEQIISICSAAHVPVILATQVLESLVKNGVPSRAEVIDAANGRRASCVMLNKGKHIVRAVSTLDTILNSHHHSKAQFELKPFVPSL